MLMLNVTRRLWQLPRSISASRTRTCGCRTTGCSCAGSAPSWTPPTGTRWAARDPWRPGGCHVACACARGGPASLRSCGNSRRAGRPCWREAGAHGALLLLLLDQEAWGHGRRHRLPWIAGGRRAAWAKAAGRAPQRRRPRPLPALPGPAAAPSGRTRTPGRQGRQPAHVPGRPTTEACPVARAVRTAPVGQLGSLDHNPCPPRVAPTPDPSSGSGREDPKSIRTGALSGDFLAK